jgi:hypothetical protein
VALANNAYQPHEIVGAEADVFKHLDYKLVVPPPVQLVEHLLALARLGSRADCDRLLRRARALLNAGLTDYALVRFSAPCMALAATLNAFAAQGLSADGLLRRICIDAPSTSYASASDASPAVASTAGYATVARGYEGDDGGDPLCPSLSPAGGGFGLLGVNPWGAAVAACRQGLHAAIDLMAAAGDTAVRPELQSPTLVTDQLGSMYQKENNQSLSGSSDSAAVYAGGAGPLGAVGTPVKPPPLCEAGAGAGVGAGAGAGIRACEPPANAAGAGAGAAGMGRCGALTPSSGISGGGSGSRPGSVVQTGMAPPLTIVSTGGTHVRGASDAGTGPPLKRPRTTKAE